MRIVVHCTSCLQTLEQQSTIPQSVSFDTAPAQFIADYGDDFVVRGVCPRDHKYIGYLTKERYDVLFESALLSFLMGFELEAVLGFAASLERAQELFTLTSLRATGMEPAVLEKMWKQVNRQSERQLGAFLSQWLTVTKEVFTANNSMTEFRNSVVHRGHIPLRDDTARYATWITDRLFDIVEVLRRWEDGALKEIRNSHVSAAHLIAVTEHSADPELQAMPIVSVNPPSLTRLHLHASAFTRASFSEVCAMARQTAKHRGFKSTVF